MNGILPAFASLLILLGTAGFTRATADVAGKWSGSLKTADGQSVPWYLTLRQDDDKLSGTSGPEKEADQRPIREGRIDGSTIRFTVPGGDGSGTELVSVELRLQDDELVGTMQGNDRKGQMQTFTLSLKRAKTE
jgi:hypothetical protein